MNKPAKTLATKVLDLTGRPRPSQTELEALADLAREVLAPKRRAAKVVAVPGKSKAQRRTERNARAARIRAAVFKRAAGWCEFCRFRPSAEWHHIIGGGERTAKESEETTAAVCTDCHDKWEAADSLVFEWAGTWATNLGFKLAWHEIQHRTWKANEARAAEARKAAAT